MCRAILHNDACAARRNRRGANQIPLWEESWLTFQATAKRFAANLLSRQYAKSWFLGRGSGRKPLLKRLRQVESLIDCPHEEREMLIMIDWLLTAAPAGPIVECGCFQGGSSAKLSIVAAAMGRMLYICDSFEGLPESLDEEKLMQTTRGVQIGFGQGDYAAREGDVRANIAKAGEISVCEFVRGFFGSTLPGLQVTPAMVFSDADLVSSTRDVIQHLWPRLAVGGRMFVHDINVPKLCLGITDGRWWAENLHEFPPVLFGAGYGFGFGAGATGYFEKTAAPQTTQGLLANTASSL